MESNCVALSFVFRIKHGTHIFGRIYSQEAVLHFTKTRTCLSPGKCTFRRSNFSVSCCFGGKKPWRCGIWSNWLLSGFAQSSPRMKSFCFLWNETGIEVSMRICFITRLSWMLQAEHSISILNILVCSAAVRWYSGPKHFHTSTWAGTLPLKPANRFLCNERWACSAPASMQPGTPSSWAYVSPFLYNDFMISYSVSSV